MITDIAKHYYAGIDLGGTFIKCGLVDESGRVVAKRSVPTHMERHYSEIVVDMARAVKDIAADAGIEFSDVASVGIGAPGTVDSENGVIVYSNNLGWKAVPLGEDLKRLLDKPVFITNDANAAALGESAFGAGSKYGSVILVTLGTGVGGGIILNGKLYEGYRSAGAEIGHQVIRIGGEKCTCGRRGCLEAYASATALIRSTKRAMLSHPDSAMWQVCGGNIDNVDGKTAFDGMHAGDKAAKKVVAEYISALATGLANLANTFRPEIILLGGGISKQGDALLAPLRKKFEKEIFGGNEYSHVMLGIATLGNDAGLYGAAEFAKTK